MSNWVPVSDNFEVIWLIIIVKNKASITNHNRIVITWMAIYRPNTHAYTQHTRTRSYGIPVFVACWKIRFSHTSCLFLPVPLLIVAAFLCWSVLPQCLWWPTSLIHSSRRYPLISMVTCACFLASCLSMRPLHINFKCHCTWRWSHNYKGPAILQAIPNYCLNQMIATE